MPRHSLKSAALFIAAFCLSWQCAGTGISTAQAGCGDYVHLGGIEHTPNFTLDSSGNSSGMDAGFEGLESREPHEQTPLRSCHGPHCRQQPLTPPAPVPVSSSSQHKACLIEQPVPMLPGSQALIPEISAPHGNLPGSRIERPPRRSS